MSTPTPFSLSLFCYPYRASKDTGRGHDRYVAELVDNTRSETKHVSVSVLDTGFAKNTLHGLSKLPGQALDLIRAKADVYHAITPMGGAVAALMQKQPLVVTVHDLVPFHVNDFDNPMKNRAIRNSVRACVKLAKAIIVPYQVTKDELVSRLGATPSKVHVVNYGVDHQNYFVQPNVQRADKTILFVGSVSRAKGVEVLIQAFALVKAQIPDAKLTIGGKASADQPVLDELVRTLKLRDVTFSGFIAEADLAENYARATVMVFPSLYGFGLSTLEAMACGTPVVGVRTLDATEFFADAGVLAKPDDAQDLAACLISVLASPEKQSEMARKSVAHAARFSWANTAKGNVKVYEQVLGR